MPVKSCHNGKGKRGWNPTDLAWAAGLLEGEGCFHTTLDRPRISVNMTDEDVLLRLQKVLGCGRLSGPHTYGLGHKPVWRYDLSRQDQVYAVTAAVYSQLGERRRAKARELILLYGSKPAREPNKPNVRLICATCGVEFSRYASQVRPGNVYCSQSCAGTAVGGLSPCR